MKKLARQEKTLDNNWVNSFWAYKDVLLDSSSPLAMTKSNLNKDYPMHCHDFNELVIILRGHGTHRFNKISHPLYPGMVFVVTPQDRHGYYDNQNLFLMNVIMYEKDMLSILQDLKTMAGYHSLFMGQYENPENRSINIHQFTASEIQSVKEMLETMEFEYQNRFPGYQAKLKSIFLDLAVLLFRSYDKQPEKYKDSVTTKLSSALAYMEKNYYKEISIPQMAEKANLSLRQFQRIFKEKYGMPPIQYLLNLRIQAASSHLVNSEVPISVISELCGFGDSNYFSRQFKKATGQTPRNFRSLKKNRLHFF